MVRNHVPEEGKVVSVVTRDKLAKDRVSDEEKGTFEARRANFSPLNTKPNSHFGENSLLEGENDGSKFTFLGAENRSGDDGPTLRGEFDRYDSEITKGREKALEEEAFIPRDAELGETAATGRIETALTECNNALSKKQESEYKKLQGLYRKHFSVQIAAGTIPSENMMPVLVELMLNREKPLIGASGNEPLTVNFSAQKMSVALSRADYEEFLKTARSYLLDTSVLQKNQIIQGKLGKLKALQEKFNENKSDGLRVQVRAAYLGLNREIAAQKELYDSGGSSHAADFYGQVADVVGGGITRDELMIYEVLSGIRPYVNQAELLKGLFEGEIDAFQLGMGKGKTAVILSLLCFQVSRQENRSVPGIFCHPSQFESVVGNVGEYQRSRFNQDVMVLDFTREQLKDVNQLNQLLENLRAAKRDKQVIIAKQPCSIP
jgi:hypothetical protein